MGIDARVVDGTVACVCACLRVRLHACRHVWLLACVLVYGAAWWVHGLHMFYGCMDMFYACVDVFVERMRLGSQAWYSQACGEPPVCAQVRLPGTQPSCSA